MLDYTDESRAAAERHWPGMVDGMPTAKQRHDRQHGIRLFENHFVETALARAHPIVPIVWTAPLIAFGVWRGMARVGPARTVAVLAGGWLAWTLLEYLLHRFVFHMRARTPHERQRSFVMHGYHHEYPRDRLRLVAPPLLAWPPAIIVFALDWLLLGATYGPLTFAGTALGYVAYDWTHYYTHHFRPRSPWGKWLQRYHLMHHYDEAHAGTRFGVSSPLWDWVLGTYRPLHTVRSAQQALDDGLRQEPASQAQKPREAPDGQPRGEV